MTRILYLLLAVVALAAAVLSFDALHGLAVLCGFTPGLAPLLPVTVDAGAAAGSVVWLTRPPGSARRFGRALALVLLAGSVAGNALGHGLAAYSARPSWWVVVLVSAVPPAVLGAVVHLAVLAGRKGTQTVSTPDLDRSGSGAAPLISNEGHDLDQAEPGAALVSNEGVQLHAPDRAAELIEQGAGRRRLARELEISEHQARELLAERRNGHAVVTS